ncbi:hypothetical protein R84865_001737 [Carnimonas sp. R-84865]
MSPVQTASTGSREDHVLTFFILSLRYSTMTRKKKLTLSALIIVVIALIATYFLSPRVRLWITPFAPPDHGKQVDLQKYDGAWFDATRMGRIDILSALHDAGYPLDRQTGAGYTAVILAAYDDQPKALDWLLHQGANACLGDSNGNTALMGALYKGENAIAERLLDTSCSLEQRNNAGETAVAFATLFGRTQLLTELAKRGADLSARDARGETPKMVAARQGNQRMVDALNALQHPEQ